METLDLESASKLLNASPSTVLELIKSDGLPASKIGRAFVFVDVDLIDYIRSKYGLIKDKKCHSTKGAKSGGILSRSMDRELENLLTPVTKRRLNQSMTE